MKVGIIGIGGLGHLALQFGRAMGYEVTAFSRSPDKEKQAREMGAHRFVVSTGDKQMEELDSSLDLIISTVSANLPWDQYLNILRPEGVLCVLGILTEPMQISSQYLISGQRSIVGSGIGSRRLIKEMLRFAAEHDVKPMIEITPMDDVNAAIEKVRKNQARYRMVLKR